jgi:phage shock protein PspC (stress-responsive transcriptional regulator)
MRRVITASLNGNAYQIEDDAFAVLAAYLDEGARALAGNPDKAEIIADLEQAIADKCARYLSPHKTVIAREEIDQVLKEMGPVEGGAPAAAAAGAGAAPAPGPAPGVAEAAGAPRRLYQISEGAIVSGLCNGLAAYLHADVTIVRVIFVLLVLLSGGAALFAYLVLMFIVPYATTSEEHAAARGLPFNARALVERAKAKAAEFVHVVHPDDWQQSRAEWRAEWRRTRAEWRAEWRRTRAEWRQQRPAPFATPPPPAAAPAPVPYAAHVLMGLVLAVLGLVLAVFTIGWVIALVSLVMTGAILGWVLPSNIPFWLAIVLLVVLYQMVAWPIRALRHAGYHGRDGFHGPGVAAFDGVAGIALLCALAWYGYHHVPAIHDLWEHVVRWWDGTLNI